MARRQKDPGFSFTADLIPDSESTPVVLKEYRQQAWKTYQELPFPSLQDEAWRRTSLRDFDFETVRLVGPSPAAAAQTSSHPGVLTDKLRGGSSTAVLSPAGVEVRLTKQVKDSGVIFCSLETAAAEHPELVKKVLGQIVPPAEGKFAAVTGAFASQGLFIYVPKGVQVEEPLFGIIFSGGEGTAFFFQTLIYLDQDASLSYLQETLSPFDNKESALTGENVEILVGQNARLNITELQNYGHDVWSFGHKKAQVERSGSLEWEIGALGAELSKHFVSVDLVGEGAEGRVSGLFYADGDRHISYNTLQRHLAPRTTSDLLFKGALNGSSRTVWRGMIYVAPGARFIDGYQANRNLVLDPEARSDSIPGLEILNNDVRCTHGSTIGKVDQEQLFYLESRGIPTREAEQLIIQGFFEDIFSRFSVQEVGEELWHSLKERLQA